MASTSADDCSNQLNQIWTSGFTQKCFWPNWHLISSTFDQLDIPSTRHLINSTFDQLNIWSTQHLINSTLDQHAIQSTRYLINLTFNHLNCLSTHHSIDLTFNQLDFWLTQLRISWKFAHQPSRLRFFSGNRFDRKRWFGNASGFLAPYLFSNIGNGWRR